MRKLLTVSSILALLVTGTVSGADITPQVDEVKSAEQESISEDFSYQNSFLNFLYKYFINGDKITELDNKKDYYYYLNENMAYFFSKEVPLDSEFTTEDYFRYKDTIRQDGIEVLKWEGTDYQNYLKSETKHFLANFDSSWIPQPSKITLKGKYNTAVELFKINQQALRLGVLIGEKRKIDKQAYTLLALENAYREVCGEATNHGEHVDFDYGTERLPDSYTEAYSMNPLYNFLKNACETYLSVGSNDIVQTIGEYVAEYNRMKMYSFGMTDPAGVVFSCEANVIYCPNSGYEPMPGTYCIYN
uniref:hypothetical protein n=1 Tax=Desulfurobacterium sp. TaxID=2004706 RepID=UPI00260CD703